MLEGRLALGQECGVADAEILGIEAIETLVDFPFGQWRRVLQARLEAFGLTLSEGLAALADGNAAAEVGTTVRAGRTLRVTLGNHAWDHVGAEAVTAQHGVQLPPAVDPRAYL